MRLLSDVRWYDLNGSEAAELPDDGRLRKIANDSKKDGRGTLKVKPLAVDVRNKLQHEKAKNSANGVIAREGPTEGQAGDEKRSGGSPSVD